jgi:hypothetical protein
MASHGANDHTVETVSLRRSAGSKVMAYARSSEFPFLIGAWILFCATGVVASTLMYFFS